MNLVKERIELACERLKLTEITDNLDRLAEEASGKEMAYSDFLIRLLDMEVTAANESGTPRV